MRGDLGISTGFDKLDSNHLNTILIPNVAFGGIVLLDDYDAWDGSARATQNFLSKNKSRSRQFRTPLNNIAYIQKIDKE
ncbi:hypothetical protein N9985_01725 [Gammaproteobacteria bacterium]|nr:hypothetical protein [Gammaproteobacteria bacterium]